MIPPILHRKLGQLRRWESTLRFLWGSSRWLVLVLALLALACLTDFVIDRFYATPWPLRLAMFLGQIVIGLLAAGLLIAWPLSRGLSDDELALQVEDKYPLLHHRLISVVQFHGPRARLMGMSEQLIVRVTEETETQTANMNFASVADGRRFGWSLAVLLPALLLAGLAFFAWPEIVLALLGRQVLLETQIPRSAHIASITPEVLPKGEKFALRFKVKLKEGLAAEDLVGRVRIDPERQRSRYYTLIPDPKSAPEDGIYLAAYKKLGAEEDWVTDLDEATTNFTYYAWLADGRMEQPAELHFEPRPVIEQINAWAQLPEYCGVNPITQAPYEIEQPHGDIVTIADSGARVRIQVQKPIKKATLQLLGPLPMAAKPTVIAGVLGMLPHPLSSGLLPLAGDAAAQVLAVEMRERQALLPPEELVLREIIKDSEGEQNTVEFTFALPPTATGYRIVAEDQYGFRNIPAPRRSIRIVEEAAPQVALLPEEFAAEDSLAAMISDETIRFDGMPVPPGGRIRIAYSCTGPYGLGGAKLWFRVSKTPPSGSESSAARTNEAPWRFLPLAEEKGNPALGPFQPRKGAFLHSGEEHQVPFHAVPSPLPDTLLGRTSGGGRFDFNTTKLPDGQGGYFSLEPGDQIEFYVEVYADKNLRRNRPTARTETRTKAVVSVPEFVQWLDQTLQEERRIRSLEHKQHEVFPLGAS